ncbi:GDP-mannose 4,6-dehydratase [Candidatus Parcubacteria bacterium]|nr:GDP-mannose 4,6-dehydratase [Candidatus Parcubacteria bacterium]
MTDYKNIKTIILCGGMGTRMKEETDVRPKPMVEIGGKPVLWHIMKIYNHYGYRDFVLALGYKSNYIKDYFLNQRRHSNDFLLNSSEGKITDFFENGGTEEDFNITFAETGLETPHGERVLKVRRHITEDIFMVTYGDGVSNIDIDKLIEFHKSHGKMGTITGVHPESRWGLVNSDADSMVTEFAQKPMLYDYVNGGFMVFNKEFFDVLQPGDMIEDGLIRLIEKKQLGLYKHEGFWYGMDTYKDLLHLNGLWEKDPKWKIWDTKPQESTGLLPVPQKPSPTPPAAQQKTVLITGGAGFIGSNLAGELVKRNQRVIIIDDLSSGKRTNVPAGAVLYQMDVRDKKVADIFETENPSVVFHFAAKPLVHEVYTNPYDAIETNIMGTVNILEICRNRQNLESIIIVSSDKAYGKAKQLPYTETSPLQGDHPYDVSKSSADLIAQTYAKTYGLPILITRFSNVFGPGDANFSRIIPDIIKSIRDKKELLLRSDGTMIREYTYVKDIVDGCIKLANHKQNFGEAFNFGSENIFSVIDVIKKSEQALNEHISYKILNTAKNEIPAQYLDWSKAKEKLHWEPKTTFEQGIKETFQWHNANFKD